MVGSNRHATDERVKNMGLRASVLEKEKDKGAAEESMLREMAIQSLQRTYVKLAPSNLEGVGVFALRDIEAEVVVMRWDW